MIDPKTLQLLGDIFGLRPGEFGREFCVEACRGYAKTVPDVVEECGRTGVKGVIIVSAGFKETGPAGKALEQKILENAKKYKADAKIVGMLVQEMAPQSTEVIVGSVKDPTFGQTVMFGLGGIFVEMLKDVTFRVAPLSQQDAMDMVTELKAYPLLKGYRNNPPADIQAIVQILLCVSNLVLEHPEIKEIDLNPVIVTDTAATVVDARVMI